MAKETRFGFPFESIPSSWYQVAWADEVRPGEVRPLKYFGRDLVLFRTVTGDFAVLDAFCPHYGAHLGYGGEVKDCDIVCPFHGWQWNAAGRNTWAPLDGRAREEVAIASYPVVVRNSIVWVWYDREGAAPMYEIPEVIDAAAVRYRPIYPDAVHGWQNVHLMPQYLVENSVDAEHFRWVHGAAGPLSVALKPKRPSGCVVDLRVSMVLGYGKARTWLTPDGPVEATIDSQIWGMGANFANFGVADGAVLIESHTPVDIEHSDLFVSVFLPVEENLPDLPPLTDREKSRIREQIVQLQRDLPILENLRYIQNPAYSRTEGSAMSAIRKWSEQFYPGSG
jgi:nitrite reductase/ring-hydroxylating ferredoxin subunit